jgi:hypothetical protein
MLVVGKEGKMQTTILASVALLVVTGLLLVNHSPAPDSVLQGVSSANIQRPGVHIMPLRAERTPHFTTRAAMVQLETDPVSHHKTDLVNYMNTVFYATVQLGTPAETFKVVVDTGSFILWVPDAVCKSPACLKPGAHRFSVHDSSTGKVVGEVTENGKTYVKAGQLQYGTGAMQGVQVEDTVAVGGVSIPSVGMLVATDVADEPFLKAPFDGILGIGRGGTKQQEGIQFNVMTAAFDAKKIAANMISFYFSLNPTDPAKHNAGAVVVGGVDPSLYKGPLRWHDVVTHGPEMWTLNLDKLSVGNGPNLCPDGCVGVIDTGTSLIVTESTIAESLNKQLGVGADCKGIKQAPNVNFVFSGSDHMYKLPAHSVLLEAQDQSGNTMCAPAIRTMDGGSSGEEGAVDTTIAADVPAAGTSSDDDTADAVVPEHSRRLLGGDSEVGGGYGGPPGPPAGGSKWDQITSMFGGKKIVIVGDIFLRHHYSAFDNTDPGHARIGLATSNPDVDLDALF